MKGEMANVRRYRKAHFDAKSFKLQKVENRKGKKMRSVKIDDSVADKVKDLKKHIRAHKKLPVTEAQILSQAFEMAFERRDELIERLKKKSGPSSDFWKFWMTPVKGGPPTDAAKDHDVV